MGGSGVCVGWKVVQKVDLELCANLYSRQSNYHVMDLPRLELGSQDLQSLELDTSTADSEMPKFLGTPHALKDDPHIKYSQPGVVDECLVL